MDILFRRYRTHIYLVSCIIALLAGYGIFLRGFLAFRATLPGVAFHNNTFILNSTGHSEVFNHSSVPRKYGRLMFVLIDALRADFVLSLPWGEVGQSGLADVMRNDLPADLRYIKEKIDTDETLAYLARAHPPTVTMARIKVAMENDL